MGHDIFLSYRRADQALARELVGKLESRGVAVWWDAKIEAGVDWRDAIVENLIDSDMLVILFSEECNGSKQLKKELAMADDMDKDVIPVLIEDTKPKGHFLYELAARNWIQAFPNASEKISELCDHLTSIAEKSPGGLEGVIPGQEEEAPPEAPPPIADKVADVKIKAAEKPKAKPKPKKVKPPKHKKDPKDLNDFLPFKWLDLVFLVPALGAFSVLIMQDIDAGDGPSSDILATIILCVAIIAMYGAAVFPFRYYFRRRRLWRAVGRYFASALTLYALFIGLFIAGKSAGLFPYDDISEFAGVGAIVWGVFSVIAFVLYGILNFQRAIRSFNSNVQKI